MRDWVNRFGLYILAAALILAGVVFFLTYHSGKPPALKEKKAFYVDEDTGEESVHPVAEVPPLAGKDGKPTVVQAIKYTCDGGKTSKISYMQKYTPEAKQALERMYATGEQPNMNIRANLQVRSAASGSQWYSADSNEGQSVMEFSCPEGRAEVMQPPQ